MIKYDRISHSSFKKKKAKKEKILKLVLIMKCVSFEKKQAKCNHRDNTNKIPLE